MRKEDLTAYCGLYCGDCLRFQCKASDLAKDLLDQLEKVRFTDYAKVKRKHKPEFEAYEGAVRVLRAIEDLKCEIPCRLGGDGCGGSCEIIRCVRDKSLRGCWDCAAFETCGKLDFLTPYHGDAPRLNLRKIKELGLKRWAEHREKCYPWL